MREDVSVIITVYNRSDQLKRAIKSVINQSHQNFEIIVIDDCSDKAKYNIKEIVSEYNDDRITYIRNEINRGVSYSRNMGIKKSKYDYIAFLDSDDEWLPKKLENQLSFINSSDLNVVHTDEIWVRDGKKVNQKKIHKKSGGDIFIPSLSLCLISPSSVMLKKQIFDRYGLFDEALIVCEDYDMWLRITAFEEVGFIEKPQIIKYGGHIDQLSRKYEAMDRYRVVSGLKLLKNESLNRYKKEKLIEVLLYKTQILLTGAIKREKNEDEKIYKEWQSIIQSNR